MTDSTDISLYLAPVPGIEYTPSDNPKRKKMGELIDTYDEENNFPDIDHSDMVILGVNEDRQSVGNNGCANAPDIIRNKLYDLHPGDFSPRIADIGNIRKGHKIEDTYFALRSVAAQLIRNKIVPVILGGSQDLTLANYQAYESLGHIINIVSVDSEFDIGEAEGDVDSRSFLSNIILHQPNFLFNYTNIGYQTYFVNQEAIRLMKNMFFDVYRVGEIRAKMQDVEPLVRNADLLSFDMSSVRFSDAPGNANASPNGFYGEEACQIIRYAGLSDKLTSIGFYECNPVYDKNDQTAHLVAQMIWYFIEGFYKRHREFPYKEKQDYLKYIVKIEGQSEEIIFYKSKKSDRWWMEVNCSTDMKAKYERHYLVPCSFTDYQIACENDIPDRWWQAYQKLM